MRGVLFAAAALALFLGPAARAQMSLRMYCDKPDPVALAAKALAETEPLAQAAADEVSGTEAVHAVDRLRQAFEKGEALDPPYGPAARYAGLARRASDPMLAELYSRVAKDQFARSHVVAGASRTGWAAGLTPGAAAYATSLATTMDWCGVDQANTAWLEKQIDAHGWFKRSVYGADAAIAAFLLVQHADLNRPFQKKVLAMLEPLLATNDVRSQDYALLFDRVAVSENRPQRYGSQGACTGPGVWTEKPVEDPVSLDKMRASVGLEPMASYRARFVASCGGASPSATASASPGTTGR